MVSPLVVARRNTIYKCNTTLYSFQADTGSRQAAALSPVATKTGPRMHLTGASKSTNNLIAIRSPGKCRRGRYVLAVAALFCVCFGELTGLQWAVTGHGSLPSCPPSAWEITFMVITILYGILVLFDFLAGEETTAGIRKHAAGPLY